MPVTAPLPDPALLREPAERVSPRARYLWALGSLGSSAFLIGPAVAANLFWDVVDVPWWGWVLLAALELAYAVLVGQWRYLVHRWEVTETAVHTQTGWWTRERRIAPMSRIQTVDHVEGAVARLLGLATVTVTTASAAGALRIAGLEAGRARQLVAELTVMSDAVEGDAT